MVNCYQHCLWNWFGLSVARSRRPSFSDGVFSRRSNVEFHPDGSIGLLVLVGKERYGAPFVQSGHASGQICGAPTLKLENPFQRAGVVCDGAGGQFFARNPRYGCLSPHLPE
jgi:hypothetical protein